MLWECPSQTSATTITHNGHTCGTACSCNRIVWNVSSNQWDAENIPPPPELPIWQEELRATPRRMKRPFPASKAAPNKAYRRACY